MLSEGATVERIPVGNRLGECVLWDGASQSVWWTDIEGLRLYRLDWRTRDIQTFVTPARLASFGFVAGRRELIAAFDRGLALFDPESGRLSDTLHPEGLMAGMRLNDGRVDRQGRFWVGSMVEDPEQPAEARLYCLTGGQLQTHLRGIGIANGLCWSPDGTVCYFADSRHATIWRFAFDAKRGILSDRRDFARSVKGCPDGAAVDSEGFLWSAQWGCGCVVRYAPDGRIDRIVEVPVEQPSCVAFGGPDLDQLFVTSAQVGLTGPQTGAGDLFVYNAGIRGLPESRFACEGCLLLPD